MIRGVERGNHRVDAARCKPESDHDTEREFAAACIRGQTDDGRLQEGKRHPRKKVVEIVEQIASKFEAARSEQAENGEHEQKQWHKSKEKFEGELGGTSEDIIRADFAKHVASELRKGEAAEMRHWGNSFRRHRF